jgi:CRISPR-associated protein Csd2
MQVLKVLWWEQQGSGKYSSAKVHGSLKVESEGTYKLTNFENLKPEEINGF